MRREGPDSHYIKNGEKSTPPIKEQVRMKHHEGDGRGQEHPSPEKECWNQEFRIRRVGGPVLVIKGRQVGVKRARKERAHEYCWKPVSNGGGGSLLVGKSEHIREGPRRLTEPASANEGTDRGKSSR